MQFLVAVITKNNSVKSFLILDQVKEMSFIDISYLEFWPPLCLAEWNHLCNFGRGHHQEHFCEFIINLDQRFRCCLKDLSRALAALMISGVESFKQFW